jgi:hypothetical protein
MLGQWDYMMNTKWTNVDYTDFKNVKRAGYRYTEFIDFDDDEYGLSSECIVGSIIPSLSLHTSNEDVGMKYCATKRIDDTLRHTHNMYFEKLTEAMIWIETYDNNNNKK